MDGRGWEKDGGGTVKGNVEKQIFLYYIMTIQRKL